MPKRSSKEMNELASSIVRQAAGDQTSEERIQTELAKLRSRLTEEETRRLAGVILGFEGGKRGGKARAEKLSKKKRKEIARKAAQARWGSQKNSQGQHLEFSCFLTSSEEKKGELMFLPENSDSIVAADPALVDAALQELGLNSEILRKAVEAGQFERDSCTLNDPPGTAGYEAWRWPVRILREELIPLGWKRLNRDNLPLVVEPDKRIAIAVASGTAATGCLEYVPTTKNPKGSVTHGYVVENQQKRLNFGPEETQSQLPLPKVSQLLTYLLLIHPHGDGTVRSELSLPAKINELGRITKYRERLILPIIAGGDSPGDEEFGDAELDIPVRRRA